MIFFISTFLLVWSSLILSSQFASVIADRFWVFIASVMLQLGLVTSLTSLVHQLNPAGWLFSQLLICALVLFLTRFFYRLRVQNFTIGWKFIHRNISVFFADLSHWDWIILLVISAILIVSVALRVIIPLSDFDERMYHASRVMYWIQYEAALPFVTHNIRQTLLTFGSELFFLWPVLLTKTELIGRLVFWLAYPLAAIGQYLLLRKMKLSRTTALIGVLILIATPNIASSAITLKPEIWSVVTLLGVAYWATSICLTPDRSRVQYFLLAIFLVLSINIRAFSIAILPSLMLIIFWANSSFSLLTRLKHFFIGLVCAVIMSGLLLPLVSNAVIYQHPLGPKDVRQFVEADITPRVMYTHIVRFAFSLLEIPYIPVSAETRTRLSNIGNRFISIINADTPLSSEDNNSWQGKFVYVLPRVSPRFSLWGLIWLPLLPIATWILTRNVAVTWPKVRLTLISTQSLLALPLLFAILFRARWMVHGEVPMRFLISPYALFLPIGILVLAPYIAPRRLIRILMAILIAYSIGPLFGIQTRRLLQAISLPIPRRVINEPFGEAVDLIPLNSRILLIGNQSVRDYPLFSPSTHYSNAVIPWGTKPFEPARIRCLLASKKVTHVLIQDEEQVSFQWFPDLDTREMVRWLTQEPRFRQIPLSTPRMRLFETTESIRMNQIPFQTVALPSASPLIAISPSLQNQVGLNPTFLTTPWPVERLSGTERGFLWLGQGYAEGIEFELWSRQNRTVDIQFEVSPGPNLTTSDQRVLLLHNGSPAGDEQTFQSHRSLTFHVNLQVGRNRISFYSLHSSPVASAASGDPRNRVVGLHEIQVKPSSFLRDDQKPETLPEPISADPNYGRNVNLAQMALKAVGFISRNQQGDGYWLTSHTKAEKFENPTLEMNTFVTSLIVDLLEKRPIMGLFGTLERARTHLRRQIEPSGLVRYHGRPDSPTRTGLGLCIITPDSDDTALVWRIAPDANAPELKANALTTLKRYRTADGLYKTWLGHPSEYQCINPGSDPNPTDIGIQMHILKFLAEIDRREADLLCTTLRRTINQDRLWVYYRKAPLVPSLRLADLHAAGCPLQIPPSRLRSDVAGQNIWMTAVQMLQGMEKSNEQLPSSTEVIKLLQELSIDNFYAVRLNPPLLYHNDLTASVSRFYWSEDVGYAIWLNLYSEALQNGLFTSPNNTSNN